MSRKGENIYKRKDGRWEGRYFKERVNGKIRYGAVYARTYREVKEKLEKAKSNLRDQKSELKAGKVDKVSEKWLEENEGKAKRSTIMKYEDLLRCHILPEFGNMELSEITNEHIMDFINRLLRSGGKNDKGLSASTVSEILSIMNGLRLYALKRKYRVEFSTECVQVKRDKKQSRVFSLAEEKKLIVFLKAHPDHTTTGILLCLFTGIRLGELCALKWDDIDLEEHILRINKTMQRIRIPEQGNKTEVQILKPKSSCSIRTIPLPDEIIDLLRKYYTPSAFLLTGKAERYVEPRTMQYRFKRILKQCGIDNANFHTTRHTFATRCVELGFDVKSLSEILGHASVSITMNRYVHPSMELKAENMKRLTELFPVR